MRWCVAAIFLAMLGGCSTPVAHSEKTVARHINESISIDGEYKITGDGEVIHNDWGDVKLQRADSQGIAPGSYIRATGIVSRGKLVNGKFVPDTADANGMRSANDLVLQNAKVQVIP